MEFGQMIMIGLLAGVASGLFGIGGGLIVVPFLIYMSGLSVHTAMGTSLGALLFPVGLLGVIQYHKAGHIDLKVSMVIALGIFIGTYFGAKMVQPMSPVLLRRIYAVFLILVAGKMLLGR